VVGDLGCGTGAGLGGAGAVRGAGDRGGRVEGDAVGGATPAGGSRQRRAAAGALEALPVADGELDAAVLSLVLHYVPEPVRALAEARRALRPGGRLVVVDMVAHGRAEYREQMGHVWQGFTEAQLRGWLEEAGFTGRGIALARWRALRSPDAAGEGAAAVRGERDERSRAYGSGSEAGFLGTASGAGITHEGGRG
jgi:SAM-dependent methyltransferase